MTVTRFWLLRMLMCRYTPAFRKYLLLSADSDIVYTRFHNIVLAASVAVLTLSFTGLAFAHGVAEDDQGFLVSNTGVNVLPWMYLGAKHMVTGYDHLLFLAGVIFFLYRLRDVALYVTLFAIGHSTTLIAGVLGGIYVNPYFVDAIIGLSVVYKAFDNIGGFKRIGWNINTRAAVLVFGFFHGFGLSTKLQDFNLSPDGLVANMISFNVGVELGQFAALAIILIAINLWRLSGGFRRHAYAANVVIMSAGFMLMGYQLTGLVTTMGVS